MSDPTELVWCHRCYGFFPWYHDPRRPPLRIRLRRCVGRPLRWLGQKLVGDPDEPELHPPPGYHMRSQTIAVRKE